MPTPAKSQAADESRYFDPIEILPRPELLKLQEQRLLEQVAYVAERSPLVRRVWAEAGVTAADIRSVADFLAKVPFIDKDSLRQHRDETGDPYGGVLCVDEREVDLVGTSSGTTGDPTVFGESWTAAGRLPLLAARDLGAGAPARATTSPTAATPCAASGGSISTTWAACRSSSTMTPATCRASWSGA